MSNIEDLAEISDLTSYGSSAPGPRHRAWHKHAAEYCGSGHLWSEETTRWYIYRGRRRRICRICDKLRHKPKQCSSIAAGIAQAGGNQ